MSTNPPIDAIAHRDEVTNVARVIARPATRRAQAINFAVANMALFGEMIEKCSATVVGSLEPRRRGMRQIDQSWQNQQRTE